MSNPRQPQPTQDATPQLFTVDSDGNGAGRIVSETGDVYEGSFLNWHRHGFGIQRWSTGAVYRGSWEMDQQSIGVFVDVNGGKWKGNFRTGAVERIEETSGGNSHPSDGGIDDTQQEEKQQHSSTDDDPNDPHSQAHVTHFPSSNFQLQYEHEPFSQTQSYPSDGFNATQPLTHYPPPPASTRSDRSSPRRRRTGAGASHSWTPRRVPFTRTRESKAQREEREAREKAEEKIVLKELAQSTHLMSNRFGSSRLPCEATFGLDHDSPGPGAYTPSLTQTKRAPPKLSMAPRLPFQSEVHLAVKSTPSQGPWSTHVAPNNPSKPSIPSVSLPQPPLLPEFVKDSTYFNPLTPGPGFYSSEVSAKGKSITIAKNTAATADHGGYQIKGHPIPMYMGAIAMSKLNLGRGADAGLYSPRLDFVRDSSPSYTMAGRSRDNVYKELRLGQYPSPASYTPRDTLQRVDPLATVTGWGRSRAGNRPTPVESTRAIAYHGEKFMRNQLGLASPGPAAYNLPTHFSPALPKSSPAHSIGFTPHLVQPPSIRLAHSFIQTQHPFVEEFKTKQAAAADGQQNGNEGGIELEDETQQDQ